MSFSKFFFALFWGVILSLSFSSAATFFKLNLSNPNMEGEFSERYSKIHFTAGGNNFWGIIFWSSLTSETVNISGTSSSNEITCNRKMRGLYYNSQRWERLWPLDEWTAIELWYDLQKLTIEGGLYTNCGGSSGQEFGIYGYLRHKYNNGTWYELSAGVQYDAAKNIIFSDSDLHPTLQRLDNKYQLWLIYDYNGGGIWVVGCEVILWFDDLVELVNDENISTRRYKYDMERAFP